MVDNLEPGMKASVWHHRGLILWDAEDRTGATAAWREAMKAAPTTTAAKDAQDLLDEHAPAQDDGAVDPSDAL